VRPYFGEHRRNVLGKPLRRERGGGVLVKNPFASGFERGRDGARRLSDILVEQTAETFRFVPRNHRVNEEEELMLSLAEMVDRGEQRRDIALLLFLDDSSWMLARRCQMNARLRAVDLDQALGSAADRADARPQRRAVTTPFPATA
jgi:hypothetical protein